MHTDYKNDLGVFKVVDPKGASWDKCPYLVFCHFTYDERGASGIEARIATMSEAFEYLVKDAFDTASYDYYEILNLKTGYLLEVHSRQVTNVSEFEALREKYKDF